MVARNYKHIYMLTSSLDRVAAPWDLIPLFDRWQLQVSVGVESVAALS